MNTPIIVDPQEDYKIFVKYSDGLEGIFNCKKLLKKKEYKELMDIENFNQVYIDEKTKDICWNEDLTMCKNALYRILELQKLSNSLNLE